MEEDGSKKGHPRMIDPNFIVSIRADSKLDHEGIVEPTESGDTGS